MTWLSKWHVPESASIFGINGRPKSSCHIDEVSFVCVSALSVRVGSEELWE